MKRVLLVSGGVDSTYIYNLKKDQINELIYFDYGHAFKKQELIALKKNKIKFKIAKINNIIKNNVGFFYGRNLRFIIKVREMYPEEDVLVWFGNCAEDNFPDNSREYLHRVEAIINNSYPKTLRIICPLENMTKKEIYNKLKDIEPKASVYWCDKGNATPCGKCHSCRAMKDAGLLK